MEHVDGDALAELVIRAHGEFNCKLHEASRFPTSEFRVFFDAVVRYVGATRENQMIHRNVAVNGLRESLEIKSPEVPGRWIADADRLECMLFGGFDPYFEGPEPPGL